MTAWVDDDYRKVAELTISSRCPQQDSNLQPTD